MQNDEYLVSHWFQPGTVSIAVSPFQLPNEGLSTGQLPGISSGEMWALFPQLGALP